MPRLVLHSVGSRTQAWSRSKTFAPWRCQHRFATAARKTAKSSNRKSKRRANLRVMAGPVQLDEDDLMQHPDRLNWYETKFCAEDMPDWNQARYVSSQQLTPQIRNVVLECEISREKVPLRNAYKCIGQRASVRVNQGVEYEVLVGSPPHSLDLNRDSLFKVRNDLFAYEIKMVKEVCTVKIPLHLYVSKESAADVYNMNEDDAVEVGPFKGTGINLRGSQIMGIYRYPTVVLFVAGDGIAAARALIESPADIANLNISFRTTVKMYYKAANDASFCYRDSFDEWRSAGCDVVTTTSSFQEAFDDDDTFAYTPEYCGALILTGGDEEAEKEAREVCREAEISEILSDVKEQGETVYLSSTTNNFQTFSKKKT